LGNPSEYWLNPISKGYKHTGTQNHLRTFQGVKKLVGSSFEHFVGGKDFIHSLIYAHSFLPFYFSEFEGRDYSCVIASLIQVLIDSHCRTIDGFQSLVQKEWVAMGHKFTQRLGIIAKNEQEEVHLPCTFTLHIIPCTIPILSPRSKPRQTSRYTNRCIVTAV
jgi:hypothetical protein